MTSKPTFRPARLADAATLTVLMDIAGEGVPNRLWLEMARPGHSALEVGRERARREEGGFSYRHTTVAEIDDEIVACLIGYVLDDPYDLSDLDDMPEPFRPLIRLEAQAPGTWYVNVMATFAEYRGQGLGTELLNVAAERTREAGASASSIIVGSWNTSAERLYVRCGYQPIARDTAILPESYPHSGDWILMVRPLP
ncbi:MAG: GNAT family N-acetyltransferase [Pseudomonadota bacterium]